MEAYVLVKAKTLDWMAYVVKLIFPHRNPSVRHDGAMNVKGGRHCRLVLTSQRLCTRSVSAPR